MPDHLEEPDPPNKMKRYIVDTNIFLRFILRDHEGYYQKAKNFFTQAKTGKIKLILLPEVVLEINYVLRGQVYSLSREKTANILVNLVQSSHIEVKRREALIRAIEKYKQAEIDLADLLLHEIAKEEGAEVISFDEDFKKIRQLDF